MKDSGRGGAARTLRLVASDGSLDVTLSEGLLSYTLVMVIGAWRGTLDEHRFGNFSVDSSADGRFAVKFSNMQVATLYTSS